MPEDLATLRRQTLDFIGYNPVALVLNRIDTVPDGAGGFQKTMTPLPTQTFRKITQTTSTAVMRVTIDGQEVQPDFVVLGTYDADVKTGDWFFLAGKKYEIVYVRDDRRYETWGEVVDRG